MVIFTLLTLLIVFSAFMPVGPAGLSLSVRTSGISRGSELRHSLNIDKPFLIL